MSISLMNKYSTCHVIVYSNKPFVDRNKISPHMHYSTFFYIPTDLEFRYDHFTGKKIFLIVFHHHQVHIWTKPVKKRVLLADDNPTNYHVIVKDTYENRLWSLLCQHRSGSTWPTWKISFLWHTSYGLTYARHRWSNSD